MDDLVVLATDVDDHHGPVVLVETAHTVELSPESVSKAQKIVTGSGYITASDLGDVEFTDEQALELSAEIARQMEKRAGGFVQPPSAELAGMVV